MATVNPARAINRLPKLGTLQVGAPGDVTMLEVVEGPGRVRRHAQQQARGQGPHQAGADRRGGHPVRPALLGAFQRALTRVSQAESGDQGPMLAVRIVFSQRHLPR